MTTTVTGSIPEPTTMLRDILWKLERIVDPTDASLNEVARRLDLVDQITLILNDLTVALQMDIAERMEDDTQVIAGIGQFVRRKKESSVWKDETSRERMFDDAKRAIAQKVARDPMTGEIMMPLVQVARETFDLIEESFSLGAQPKAAFRKRLGLQPDEYRVRSTTGYTVRIDRGIEGEPKASTADLPEPF
jgi:hypothetical protein